MLPHEPRRVSISSLRECTHDHKVVLIPPWTDCRALFVSHFLAHADEGLLYSRMPEGELSLADWLRLLQRELRRVLPEFGKALDDGLGPGKRPDPARLGTALAADLNAAAEEEPMLLYIDEFDPRDWGEQADVFLTALIEELNGTAKIVLSSRVQSYSPFDAVVASGVAVVLGVEWDRGTLRFVLERREKPQLEVSAFGTGLTRVNGAEIKQWEGQLPRMLFYYLMDHPLITRDQIFADFWPKVSTKDATDIFHVTKHKVSEVLNRPLGGQTRDLTQYTQGFYLPGAAYVRHYDVAEFEAAVERAHTAEKSDEREMHARIALGLYKAPYMQDVTVPWVVQRREQLARRRAEAQVVMGRVAAEQHRFSEAIAAFREALEVLPLREDVRRALVQSLIENNQVDEARQQMAALEDKTYKRMGLKPTPETKQLRERLDAIKP